MEKREAGGSLKRMRLIFCFSLNNGILKGHKNHQNWRCNRMMTGQRSATIWQNHTFLGRKFGKTLILAHRRKKYEKIDTFYELSQYLKKIIILSHKIINVRIKSLKFRKKY